MLTPILRALSLSFVCAASLAQAMQADIPNAMQSDPNVIGWMQGTPPPADKVIAVSKGNFFNFPEMRWSVCHMRELFPTKLISKGETGMSALPYLPHHEFADMRQRIDTLSFTPTGASESMTWAESLDVNYTDGLMILHHGKVVYEYYSGCLTRSGKHALMSMTKSMVGLVAEILVAEGALNPNKKIVDYVPELESSAFGDATVRQVMDMTTSLQFDENYANPNADIWAYSAAGNPMQQQHANDAPVGYLDYLKTVKKESRHGKAFGYKTVNTDVLAWVASRASGMGFAELLSDRVWQRIGVQQDAYISVDSTGQPFAGGGMLAGLTDLARLGQIILDDGKWQGQQTIPASAVESIEQGGSQSVFKKAGYATMPTGSYRSMWWHFHNQFDAFAARGVHGQTLYIAPKANMVLVRFASHPNPKNSAIDPTSLPAYEAVAAYLTSRSNPAQSH